MQIDFRIQVQKEAVEALLSQDRASADVAMRLGKTMIGLAIAKKYKKVLVSYPFQSIKDSWVSDSQKFGIDISHIEFTTHISLPKRDLKVYDCIILDEVQDISEAQWAYISEVQPKVIKGLSGTMPKFGAKKQFIDDLCPIVYTKTLDETTGLTSKPYTIIVHLLKPSEKKDIPLKSGKFWSERAKIGFFESKYNNSRDFKAMLLLIKSIQESKTKVDYIKKLAGNMNRGLIFMETTEQCKCLGYPSYHSKEKDSEKNLELFQEGKIDKLCSISQLRAGVTFKNLNEAIIMHCYASNNKSQQRIGRTLNYVEGQESTIHIICLDKTRDTQWVSKALEDLNQDRIIWKRVES